MLSPRCSESWSRLYVARPDGSISQDLVGGSATWSPSGDRVAVVSSAAASCWVIPRDLTVRSWSGSTGAGFSRSLGETWPNPAWSADGRWLAWTRGTVESQVLLWRVGTTTPVASVADRRLQARGWVGPTALAVRGPCGDHVIDTSHRAVLTSGGIDLRPWTDPPCEVGPGDLTFELPPDDVTTSLYEQGVVPVEVVADTPSGVVPALISAAVVLADGTRQPATLSSWGLSYPWVPRGVEPVTVELVYQGHERVTVSAPIRLVRTTQPWPGCTDQTPLPATSEALWACIALARFTDVDAASPFRSSIGAAVEHLFPYAGYGDGTFRPGAVLTRQAAAQWMDLRFGVGASWCGAPFADVDATNPFCPAILRLKNLGITAGYPDGTFRPGAAMRRHALVTWLWRVSGSPVPAAPAPFVDVPAGHPSHDAIAWAAETGIVEGYADGSFRPAGATTRQAGIAMIWRARTVADASA